MLVTDNLAAVEERGFLQMHVFRSNMRSSSNRVTVSCPNTGNVWKVVKWINWLQLSDCVCFVGPYAGEKMASAAIPERYQSRRDGPPGWFPEKLAEIDWDQVRLLRSQELGTVPAALTPKPETVKYPRWPCFICEATFTTAQEVHDHVRSAHEVIHKFMLQTSVFFTRCVVCRKYF